MWLLWCRPFRGPVFRTKRIWLVQTGWGEWRLEAGIGPFVYRLNAQTCSMDALTSPARYVRFLLRHL